MANHSTQTLRGSRFTARQREVLDAIGYALKRGMIDFATASDLGEQVRAGRVEEVAKVLAELHP